ncbi:MAG TPA: TerB family tellurite resistance protein [Ignavibacteriaceae bacterium]|nr:TerB family tellurite resistance protein [Ignavibacteriaceae bacterium]
MFDYIKGILQNVSEENRTPSDGNKRIQVATCALFIEIARADDEFTNKERDIILSVMKDSFDLDTEEVNELIINAEESVNKSVSVYEFTRLLDEYLEKEGKFELLKNLWRLIYSDNTLNKYEDNLIKRIGDMLKMEHKEVIDAKLQIKQEKNIT